MDRLTKTLDANNAYAVERDKVQQNENGYCGEVIDRLAKYENFYENLINEQARLSKEMEKLRMEDKTRTVKFKQLLANKLTNSNIIVLLESYGLK